MSLLVFHLNAAASYIQHFYLQRREQQAHVLDLSPACPDPCSPPTITLYMFLPFYIILLIMEVEHT